MLKIRLFNAGDYPAISQVQNAVYPERALTEDQLRVSDQHRGSGFRFQRQVADCDGRLTALGEYDQSYTMHDRYTINIVVHPAYQNQGIGSALYHCLMADVSQIHPASVRAFIRGDKPWGFHFLRHRGFHADLCYLESQLDVESFSFEPYRELEKKMSLQGIEIKTMRDLESDPERDRKLHALVNELLEDASFPGEPIKMDFPSFRKRTLESPSFLPDGYFVALHQGEYIGTSSLLVRPGDKDLLIHLTGVKKEHRDRGIALALKLRTIAYAKEHGYRIIKTKNDTRNKPIIRLNQRFGFVRATSWIGFQRLTHPR